MKKIYKLLSVILLTFFVGIINAYAVELSYVSMYGDRAVIGEKFRFEFSYDDYTYKYNGEFTAKAHFFSEHGSEIVTDVDITHGNVIITQEFMPETYYSLGYVELIDKNGNSTKYSPFESGEFKKVDVYPSEGRFYVKEPGPLKKASIYGLKEKYGVIDNIFLKSNSKLYLKFELNFPIDSGTILLGSYSFDLKKQNDDIYEVDLASVPNIKASSYSIDKIKLVSSGKEYIYGNEYNEYNNNYIGSIFIYNTVLNDFSLEKDTVALNEKIYVNLSVTEKALGGEVRFKSGDHKFTVPIRDIDTKPYIVIPYTAKVGEYELEYISVTVTNLFKYGPTLKYICVPNDKSIGENSYQVVYDKINYDKKITVVKDESTIIGELLELDNDLITDDVIKEIKNIKDGIEINIDASSNPNVKSEVFEAIKGHDKTLNIKYNDYSWTFNGKDITEPKKLKVNFAVADFKKYEEITKAVKNGALVVFSNYGALPGKATIRFNIKEELAKEIKNKKLNLYMYDSDETQKFELIDTGIKQDKEGFYEIKLSNTSSYYVVTPEEIADKYLIGYNFPILLVVIIILSIITVIGIVVLVILKVRKGKKKKKVNKEETPKVESSKPVEKTPEEENVVEEVKKDEKEI